MLYALDRAFSEAVGDDRVKVIVLRGAGRHFSGGHDIGTPERDADRYFERRAVMWWSHVGDAGASARMAREEDLYLGLCRRWREIPKPTIAMVHGACVAGGLMLAWVCDLIVAAEDATFRDPVLSMGIPGVEYFAHPWALGSRVAREFLYTGEAIDGRRAYEVGMVNRAVPLDRLEAVTTDLADKIANKPRFGLALTKKALNAAEDQMGLRAGMDTAFALHHVAHAHNAETMGDSLAGVTAGAIKNS
jgi:enoyl-CoA hydratase